ncbi:rhamnogalacturonan acetylesterase [Plebeiibacterium marinum]|uniref:Rhamnogalacturonan acetylesterase n=1 Tax=Plebeiibacterium marinum TaxID=2992111 RepID=A0AAE3SK85_9BACT|nr:rhamnogalacturonan acetylesterase [Plebeiobacterium marinum]MCW3806347.1 rhamnogalacturonan acetylesterase [Plebeiobacterium marinum]
MRKILLAMIVMGALFSCKKEKPFTIFMIGDSTMAIKRAEVFPETGWGMVLPNYFDSLVVVDNHAVNGRSSKSFIGEGRWQVVLDSLKSGDFVFIQFGHNDQKVKSPDRYTEPYGEYTSNLVKYVKESRQKGAVPILFTSIVRRKFDVDGKLVDTHGEYPQAMKKVAEELTVPVVDLQKLTHSMVEALGTEESKELYLWTDPDDQFPEGRKDDTHLCTEGAEKVARLAVIELAKINQKLAEHIINKEE